MSNSTGATACVIGVVMVLLVIDGQVRKLATMVIEGNIDALLGAGIIIGTGWLTSWLVFELFDYYSGTKDLTEGDQ